jgi:hypothetical protein
MNKIEIVKEKVVLVFLLRAVIQLPISKKPNNTSFAQNGTVREGLMKIV